MLRGPDLNRRPSGYGPDELPGCSTPLYNPTEDNGKSISDMRFFFKGVEVVVLF